MTIWIWINVVLALCFLSKKTVINILVFLFVFYPLIALVILVSSTCFLGAVAFYTVEQHIKKPEVAASICQKLDGLNFQAKNLHMCISSCMSRNEYLHPNVCQILYDGGVYSIHRDGVKIDIWVPSNKKGSNNNAH